MSEAQKQQQIFDRYKAVQHRLPRARAMPEPQSIDSLLDLTPHIDAFVFDAFGVLNVGDAPIENAVDRIAQLRALRKDLRVLTNAASYNMAATVQKFERLGFDFRADEIITSRSSALQDLDERLWGVVAAPDDPLDDIAAPHIRLGHSKAAYDEVDGFLFLSTANWSHVQQEILETSLKRLNRPVVIANADLAAPRGADFSIEPGFWGHQIADRLSVPVAFHGKPFQGAFKLVEASLPDVVSDRIVLCGDSLHTDVLGANAAGWRSVLVTRDGLFNALPAHDLWADAQIFPNWQVARI